MSEGVQGLLKQSSNLTAASNSPQGLTAAQVRARLQEFGPNAVVEEKPHPLRQFLKRFWAPIPWLLEATIIIQLEGIFRSPATS